MPLRPEYTPADVIVTVGRGGEDSPIENINVNTKNIAIIEDEIPIEDLKSKDLRNLIEAYVCMVTQHSSPSNNEKFDLVKLQQKTKIHKPFQFFENFCQALYKKCVKVGKGFKIGQIFVTQVQVNLILKHGIIDKQNHKHNH